MFRTSVDQLLDYQDHRGFPDTDRAVLAALHLAAAHEVNLQVPGLAAVGAGGSSTDW